MRREGNIIQEIVEYNNVAAAFDHVVRGERQEYEEGKELLAKREEVIAQLQHEIATGTFTVEEYNEVEIKEYGKVRRLQIVKMIKRIGCFAIKQIVDIHMHRR